MKTAPTRRPNLPELLMEGGCYYGAVGYALTARPLAVNAGHCGD